MKKIVLIVAMLCLYGILQAKPVDATTARRVAERVLGSTELVDRSSELQLPELYLFAPADSQGGGLFAHLCLPRGYGACKCLVEKLRPADCRHASAGHRRLRDCS